MATIRRSLFATNHKTDEHIFTVLLSQPVQTVEKEAPADGEGQSSDIAVPSEQRATRQRFGRILQLPGFNSISD